MRRQFFIGDPAPDFHCAATSNANFYFGSMGGRYLVLCFFGSMTIEKNARAIDFITTRQRHHFNDDKVAFFGISVDASDRDQPRVRDMLPGIRYFWDFDRKVSILYGAMDEEAAGQEGGVAYHSFTLVLDPNLRVIAQIPLKELETHNQTLQQVLQSLPPIDAYAGVPITAPVLVIPRVFEPDFCRELITLYETHGGKESGSMIEKDGKTLGKVDYGFKRRMDYEIEQEEIRTGIRSRIVRRIIPEIKKAFQFNVTRIERYIVACYDGEHKGFFRPHRDNTTRGTAHRRFACTINLNAHEYEGGDLRFPEFGTRTYRAPTGGAVVFSCSLLHEATPVTKGRRYATLPFMYDDEAAKIREQNREFISDEVLNMNELKASGP